MTNPSPLNGRNLSRATGVAILLSAGGVILFLLLWVLLGNAGTDPLARLIVSMCVPPGIIAALVGGYFLLVRPGSKPGNQ